MYTMFIAGNDTVVHGLSRAAYVLRRVPVLGEALAASPSWQELLPLVDEILRVQSPVGGLARVALEPATVGAPLGTACSFCSPRPIVIQAGSPTPRRPTRTAPRIRMSRTDSGGIGA